MSYSWGILYLWNHRRKVPLISFLFIGFSMTLQIYTQHFSQVFELRVTRKRSLSRRLIDTKNIQYKRSYPKYQSIYWGSLKDKVIWYVSDNISWYYDDNSIIMIRRFDMKKRKNNFVWLCKNGSTEEGYNVYISFYLPSSSFYKFLAQCFNVSFSPSIIFDVAHKIQFVIIIVHRLQCIKYNLRSTDFSRNSK